MSAARPVRNSVNTGADTSSSLMVTSGSSSAWSSKGRWKGTHFFAK